MNIPLPFTEDKYAWIVICVISFFLWIALSRLLRWIVHKR
ncbi:hypothetical protein STRDD10_00196 [Streptococcus sp. DD10]|nr:hypothetical protein STRDD10_00196 [Streptococcus sp. DD10]